MRKIFSLVGSAALFMMPVLVHAASLTLPTNTGLPNYEADTAIDKVLGYITGLIAVIALLMIVVSGVMYITAAGDSSKAEKAKDMLITSITGLVIALLAYAIVMIIGGALGAQW